MSRPTIDELRELHGSQGAALGAWAKRYAGRPGSGPPGRTCGSCAFKTYTGGRKLHPKCGKTKYTHGDATTIKTSSPACHLYQEEKP